MAFSAYFLSGQNFEENRDIHDALMWALLLPIYFIALIPNRMASLLSGVGDLSLKAQLYLRKLLMYISCQSIKYVYGGPINWVHIKYRELPLNTPLPSQVLCANSAANNHQKCVAHAPNKSRDLQSRNFGEFSTLHSTTYKPGRKRFCGAIF